MTFTKCHYRAIPFYIVGFDTGKTGNTKVGQKGYFFKPALLEDEELTGSVNRKKNNDAQFSDINGLQVTILSSNSGLAAEITVIGIYPLLMTETMSMSKRYH